MLYTLKVASVASHKFRVLSSGHYWQYSVRSNARGVNFPLKRILWFRVHQRQAKRLKFTINDIIDV